MDIVGQSVCRLPMLIALFASFLCLASITIMYISSPFPIDPGTSRQAMQFITCDSYEPGLP